MQYLKSLMLIPVCALLLCTSCKDEEIPEVNNEEELITTLTLEFNDEGGGPTRTYSFKDTDGPGGAAPEIFDTIRLDPSSSYDLFVYLLNESVTPVVDITEEVYAEAEDHQMFYTVSGADVDFMYIDFDLEGHPIGLRMQVTTGDASNGTIKVTLKHQPGNKDNNINSGETDVEVTFVTEIN